MNPVPEADFNRTDFIRRAGAGAAGLSLAQLLGPAAAFAGGGGGDFPPHPAWRFVFVSHNTLDPLLVATQFGAQDAASLVRCTMQWTGSARGDAKETAAAMRSAISGKASGIAVSVPEGAPFVAASEAAERARIPVVAFNVDTTSGSRYAFVGENPRLSGARVGAEIARLVPRGSVLVFAQAKEPVWIEQRLQGLLAALGTATKPTATVVRLDGDIRKQQTLVEDAYARQRAVHGLFAVDGNGTLACGRAIARLRLRSRGVKGGGFDLLPDDLALVSNGTLDFVVDQQAYLQGFAPLLELFLVRISERTVLPWDMETSVLLRRADVKSLLATKSRFEGSSSRHEYPLRRG